MRTDLIKGMRTKTIKKNRINVVTLGCSKNVYDSEVLMGQLKASGKDVVHEQEGNVVVINTCGFINNAKEESVNTILEYMQKKEAGEVDKVFVTGCLSERYKPDLEKEITEWLDSMEHVDRTGWVCGLGHGIHKETPEANVKLFVDMVRERYS